MQIRGVANTTLSRFVHTFLYWECSHRNTLSMPHSLLRLMLYRRQALFRARLINYAFEFVDREPIS